MDGARLQGRLEALRRQGIGGVERAIAALDLGRWRASLGVPRGLEALRREAHDAGGEPEASWAGHLWSALAGGRWIPDRDAPSGGEARGMLASRVVATHEELRALAAEGIEGRVAGWLAAAASWEARGEEGVLRGALCRVEALWDVVCAHVLGEAVPSGALRDAKHGAEPLRTASSESLRLAGDLLVRALDEGGADPARFAEGEAAAERLGLLGLQWRLAWAAAVGAARCGGDEDAEPLRRRALERVERLAMAWPPVDRSAFMVRREIVVLRALGSGTARPSSTRVRGGTLVARYERLLDVLGRLASERDPSRLLERIVSSSVEMSGAERGMLLLLDAEGTLTPWRDPSAPPPSQATEEFSRSIAEAALIDGEPIVTVDAQRDARVGEFLSVHRLSLRSVAAIPVQGRGEPIGVLYLEHRRKTGRFTEEEVDLLLAFAHQVAIAVENARLMDELRRRGEELQRANEALREAVGRLEDVLAERTEALQQVQRELERARQEAPERFLRHGIVARSEPMRRLLETAERVAATAVSVVVQGESGTGKELLARAVHFASPRREGPFVALHCAAVPEELLESELFGHVKGAFTGADRDRKGVFEQAHGGTLFLDEVADMPPRMQVDLLRVLQEGCVRPVGGDRDVPVDVRVVAASRRPLRDLVTEGRFREDLYYRLAVVELSIPPLRERLEELPWLCDHLLARIAARQGTPRKRLTRDALERLLAHDWPGNVRELEHVLLGACVLGEGPVIRAEELSLRGDGAPMEGRARGAVGAVRVVTVPVASSGEEEVVWAGASASAGEPLATRRREARRAEERRRILEALESHGWNRSRAAEALGMPRRTFYRRLKEYGIL